MASSATSKTPLPHEAAGGEFLVSPSTGPSGASAFGAAGIWHDKNLLFFLLAMTPAVTNTQCNLC